MGCHGANSILALWLLVTACGGPASRTVISEPATPGAADETASVEAPVHQASRPAAAREPGLSIAPLRRSPYPGEPSVRVLNPTPDQVVRRGSVVLRLEVDDWPLSPPPGNHVHVSVDGGREMAISDLSGSIALEALVQQATGEPLPEGSHLLRVFLGRADHESVKRPGASAAVVFHFRRRTRGWSFDSRAPALVFSRPQGCASNRARLLDFQLANIAALSADGYRVRYSMGALGLAGEITDWTPHRISGLPRGIHTLELALLDPEGVVVEGSEVSRAFRVDDDCPTYAVRPYEPSEAEDDDDDESL